MHKTNEAKDNQFFISHVSLKKYPKTMMVQSRGVRDDMIKCLMLKGNLHLQLKLAESSR